MLEILFVGGQILSLAALAYGAYLVVSHGAGLSLAQRDESKGSPSEESEVWRRYLERDS